MKKLLRRWLSIDEILTNQNRLEQIFHDKEQAQDNLAEALDEVQDLALDEKMEKIDENMFRLNDMILELKGVVAITRASLVKSKPKAKKKKKSLNQNETADLLE